MITVDDFTGQAPTGQYVNLEKREIITLSSIGIKDNQYFPLETSTLLRGPKAFIYGEASPASPYKILGVFSTKSNGGNGFFQITIRKRGISQNFIVPAIYVGKTQQIETIVKFSSHTYFSLPATKTEIIVELLAVYNDIIKPRLIQFDNEFNYCSIYKSKQEQPEWELF